jgi:hypothetical protein
VPAPTDERSLSVEEVRVAAAHGRLAALAERLARERSWESLALLFEQAATLSLPVAELVDTVRATNLALRDASAGSRRGRATVDQARTIRILAGESLLKRVPRPPLTDPDRRALRVAGAALSDAGDLQRAATLFEQAQDWTAAADVWGRLGELDQMEACLAREERRRRIERAATTALRDAEALVAAGERVAALHLVEGIPEGSADSAGARDLARELGARLARARTVVLQTGDGRRLRFAAAPAVLGRDPLAELPLRDPGVSRRHALLTIPAATDGAPTLADAGSRAGIFVGGARLAAPLALSPGTHEVTLGAGCRVEIGIPGPGRVLVRGLSGLDRALLAIVGQGPLPLGDVLPEARGAWVEIDDRGVRLGHEPELAVRIGGQLVSPQADLMHGDHLEIGSAGLRLEVE